MTHNLLELTGVHTHIGAYHILHGVDLAVPKGQLTMLLGRNGAGKTTTLRTVSSAIKATAGRVQLFGQNITNHSSSEIVRAGLAHVPEGRQLFPLMSIEDNLELGASPRESAWKARAQTRDRMFKLFPRLEERRKQLAGTLSGGEQQMVAIARALMAQPKIMLVDEPSLGLSPIMTQTVFRALREVNRTGVSILLVEQNVRQSLALAHRAYVLEDGRVVQEGTGKALLEDPRVREAYLAL